MEKFKILIRTEGHLKLGMGNIFRSIRIAKKLQEKYDAEIRFILEPTSFIGIKKILDAGFKIEIVRFSKINQYLRFIKKFRPDIIVNDVLNLEEDYMKELRKLNLLTVNFEDKKHSITREYADLVFNSLYEDKETKTKYYHGPPYATINDSFKNMKKKKINKECRNFLLAFGGSDPSGFTIKVARILNKLEGIHTTIFLGPSFGSHQQLYDLLKNLDNNKFTIKYDVEYNKNDFENTDIAIASGGHTCYELAAAGAPTILLCQNEVESERGPFIAKHGTVINLGDGNKLDDAKLNNTIKKLMVDYDLRKKMTENGQSLIDGYGIDRIADAIITEAKVKNLTINK